MSKSAPTKEAGGRRITLDPLATGEVVAEARRVESSLPCGLRQGWIDGSGESDDGEEVSFSLTCGAGVGGRWLILSVEGHGEEIIDMGAMVETWVNGLLEREKQVSS